MKELIKEYLEYLDQAAPTDLICVGILITLMFGGLVHALMFVTGA